MEPIDIDNEVDNTAHNKNTDSGRYDACLNSAYRYIFKRPKTVQEVRINLRSKGHEDSIIDRVIQVLQRKKYVNDEVFVEMYVESELIKKGRPAAVVMQKLLQRGIEKNIIKQHMETYEQDITEGLQKRISQEIASYKKKGVDGFDIVQKLMKKGFRLHDIRAVIKKKTEE